MIYIQNFNTFFTNYCRNVWGITLLFQQIPSLKTILNFPFICWFLRGKLFHSVGSYKYIFTPNSSSWPVLDPHMDPFASRGKANQLYSEVIMSAMASQITGISVVYRLFKPRSKKTSTLRVTGLCAGNSPVTGEFPAQRASNAENVSIWWCHYVTGKSRKFHGL